MAVERWNKVNISYPGATSSSVINFNTETAKLVESLLSHCDDVLKLLCSNVLQTEISVLYRILYVVNNSLRQHKPFRAIKQVAQCIKRLNDMKFQAVLQDLEELCPSQIQRDVGIDVGVCTVPSQPMLEWFCLKLLGASSLLVRTLEQCIKAFSLTRQHLRLAEFIVLNLVLASMLSRLWLFFRGILRALVPVYQRTIELHKEVSQSWAMPYLTDFTLPGDLESFLGPSLSKLLENGSRKMRFHKASVLDKLFKEDVTESVAEREKEEMQMMEVLASKRVKSSMDLGKAILREGPCYSSSPLGLDIKSVLQHRYGITKQHAAEVFMNTPSVELGSSGPDLDQQKTFLNMLKTVTSFSEMAVHLKEMMSWCRRQKMRQERQHLGLILLQCQRMKILDQEGHSVQNKLRRLWIRVRLILRKGTSLPSPLPSFQWRTQRCLRSRFTTVMARYGSVRNRLRTVRTRSLIVKDLFGVTAKKTQKSKESMPFQTSPVQLPQGSVIVTQSQETKTDVKRSDEIDDIFASLGF